MKQPIVTLTSLILIAIFTISCGLSQPQTTPTETASPSPSPTVTQVPMAITINTVGISVEEYQQEMTRLQQAQTQLGISSTPEEQKQKLIDDFTNQLLLEQGAIQGGFTLDDAALQARIDALASTLGGQDKLTAWESANSYTVDTFREAMRRSIAVAWQRDQIANSVPTIADQVHVRQILVQTESTANDLLAQVKAGADFATLALLYDPVTGGDLGWFPQGYLTQPEVEAAAFALQPGQTSEIIKSAIGYHILYMIERDPQHELSPDARRVLQEKKLTEWLDAARVASQIVINVP